MKAPAASPPVSLAQRILRGARQRLLAPSRCVICQQHAHQWNVCRMCQEDLPRLQSTCDLCALPVVLGTHCGGCLLKPPPWQQMRCAVAYTSPYDALVTRLKFQGQTEVVPVMAALLIERLRASTTPSPFADLHSKASVRFPDVIVPVPIHWSRLWRRGFNQAALLGDSLSRELDIPVRHALIRTRRTQPQTLIEHKHRYANLRGAFAARSGIRNLHVALVDDVVTSGATATSATRALLAAGTRRVDLWAFARARAAHRR